MDPSKTPNEVAVPKVVPMEVGWSGKLAIAKKRADKKMRDKAMVDKIKWDNSRLTKREY